MNDNDAFLIDNSKLDKNILNLIHYMILNNCWMILKDVFEKQQ